MAMVAAVGASGQYKEARCRSWQREAGQSSGLHQPSMNLGQREESSSQSKGWDDDRRRWVTIWPHLAYARKIGACTGKLRWVYRQNCAVRKGRNWCSTHGTDRSPGHAQVSRRFWLNSHIHTLSVKAARLVPVTCYQSCWHWHTVPVARWITSGSDDYYKLWTITSPCSCPELRLK